MERPQVKTEETEEIFTSVIDIEEHEVKAEHEELDSVGNELLPFEEILTSEVASEERAVDVKMEEDPLNLWPTRYPVMTVSEDPPVRRKRKKKNCDDCGVKHKRPTLMVWHDSTCHGPDACVKVNKISDTKLEYQCVWCEVANKDPLRITHHLCYAHNIDKYLQHCSNCGKGFIFENEQKKHQQKCEEMKVQVKRSAIPQELNVFSKQSNLQCKVPSIPLKINNFTPKNQSESSNCTSNKGLLASNVPSIPLKINSITPKNNSESSICTSIRSTLSSQAPNTLLPASGKSNKCKIANYICDECAIGFFDWQMLSWHVKNFHGPNAIVNVIKNGVNKPNYLCTRCKNLYRDILSLMHHLNMKHGFSDLPFKCSVCTKSFELEMQLQNHECKNTEHNVTSYPSVSCNQQRSSDIGYNTNCPIPIRPGENLSAGAKSPSDFNTRENMKIDVFVKKVPQSYPTSSRLQSNRVHNNLFQTPMQTLDNMKADFSLSGAQHNNASNNLSRVDNELTNAPILIPSSSPENVKANVSGAQQSFSVAVRKQNRVANAVANTPLLTPRDNNMKANVSVNGVQYSNATSSQSTVVNVVTNTPLLTLIENLKANVSGDQDLVSNCTTNQSKKSNDVANTAHLTLIENMKANLSRALQIR